MRYRIDEQVVLLCMPKQGPDGPIAPYLHSFAQSLTEQGYGRCYLRRQLMLGACFSHWLKQRRIRSRWISSEHASRYLRYRHRDRQATAGDSAALDHLMTFLRAKRVIPCNKSSKPPPIPAECCAQAYERYLREDRGLAKVTIIYYVAFINDFLKDRFGVGPVKLSSLRAADVVRFVQSRARGLHVKRAKLMTTALRSFFQLRVPGHDGQDSGGMADSIPMR